MIPPSKGSKLSQDSALNKWPRENCYISGYKGPNEILQDVLDRAQIVLSVVKFSDAESETMTCGSLYKFSMLNSPEISHLGKTLISPNWWNQFFWNLRFWKEDRRGYVGTKFQTQWSCTFEDTAETISDISVEETGKLGLLVTRASLHCFQKRSTLDSSP